MFAYCGNNPIMHKDPSGCRLVNNQRDIYMPMMYGANNSNITTAHIPSPGLWEDEIFSKSWAAFDSSDYAPDAHFNFQWISVEGTVLSVTDSGFDIINAELAYLSMGWDDSVNVNYLAANGGIGYDGGNIYVGAMATVVDASYSFSFGPTKIVLTGYLGGYGANLSLGRSGLSVELAGGLGGGFSISW